MPLYSHLYAIPYMALYAFVFLCSFKLSRSRTKTMLFSYRIQVLSVFLVCCIFIGFRGFIAYDWSAYYNFFAHAPKITDGTDRLSAFFSSWQGQRWERGYVLFVVLCKTISENYFFYQFVSAFVFLYMVLHVFKDSVESEMILAFIFFILFDGMLAISFNLERNSKAIALFLISLKYAEKDDFRTYLILNLFGCFFHISSVLYIPLYFVIRRRYSTIFFLVLFIFGNLLFITKIKFLTRLIGIVGHFVPGRMGKIMVSYVASTRWASESGFSIGFMERTFTGILALLFKKKMYRDKKDVLVINALFLYVLSRLYLAEMAILVSRISELFVFSYWLFYPRVYARLSRDWKAFFLVVLFMYSVLKIYSGQSNVCYWYENVLFSYHSAQERLNLANAYRITRGFDIRQY